eukprot:CAMPEP_0115006978 /NCGR_PEP_ID=MMETSP0216-20121206/20856_1 /TAXON_ID=223996 /ORGANISM="Protocruzia adherens, Strain Boccale" /LENGTH=476 /DNA_ID=CAMNT_0002373733 /DNA_START=407 /DNA_END=1837 /DNA_ORIENTATION=+
MLLNESELHVNAILMEAKQQAQETLQQTVGFSDPGSHLFFDSKDILETTELYRTIQRMPKGGVLHAHTSAITHPEFIVREIFHNPKVHINPTNDAVKFFARPHLVEAGFVPVSHHVNETCQGKWLCIDEFETNMINKFSLPVEEARKGLQAETPYLWKVFEAIFSFQKDLLRNTEVFRTYFLKGLTGFAKDNVSYIELRHIFGYMKDDAGNKMTAEEELLFFIDLIEGFKCQYSSMKGNHCSLAPRVKIIYAEPRVISLEKALASLETAVYLRAKYPDYIVGFDLISDEALNDLYHYVPVLLQKSRFEEKYNTKLDYYFHAGETVDSPNKNVLDAILLDSRRIGHGFVSATQPMIIDMLKSKQICLEISPISNQLLGYVKDLRLHPATVLLAQGVAITINPDDPALFLYEGVTHDWVQAIMSWDLDLSGIKQMAVNSIVYAALTDVEKTAKLEEFDHDWSEFIDDIGNLRDPMDLF